MKNLYFNWLILLVAIPTFAQNLQVGAASAPINPPIGAYIAGDKQNRKFTSVHDNLYAKAVGISKGNSHVAMITIDCIGLLYPEVQKIRSKAAQLCSIPAGRIVVSSTHTHAGPDVVGIWGKDYSESGVDTVYINFLINTAATQIQKAFKNRKSAIAYSAETTFGEPWVMNICNEELDRSLTILHFKDTKQKTIATLTNFACHPTFVDGVFSEVSADYIHGYYEILKKNLGGEALFLQGAIGGWVQPENEKKTFENAFQRGKELAEATKIALNKAKPLSVNTIEFRNKKVNFPVENEGWKQLSAIGTTKRAIVDSVSTEISWFKIGEAEFITHPGETAPFYSLESKKLMGKGPKFIVGLGNDALGYILKPIYFEDSKLPHAGYLTGMSVGKQTAPVLMETIKSLISAK